MQKTDTNRYRAARKFIKVLAQAQKSEDAQSTQMRDMLAAVLDALRTCEVREDNPPLSWEHLKTMHGRPVFYSGSWGFVDTNNRTVRLLAHDWSTWAQDWPMSREHGAQVYRYPNKGGRDDAYLCE